MSPYLPLVLVTVLLWRPAEVFIGVGVGTLVGVLVQRQPVWRVVPIALASAAPATVASAVVVLLTVHLPAVDPVIAVMLGLVPAAVVYRMLHTALVLTMRRARVDAGFLTDWRDALTANPSGQGTGLLVGALLAGIAVQVRTNSLDLMVAAGVALAVPLARQELLAYSHSRHALEAKVAATIARLEAANPGARAHAERVSVLAVATGRRLGMPDQALEILRVAAWLHDINILTDPREAVAATGDATSWETPRTVRWLKAHPVSELPNADIAMLIGMYKERWIDRPTAGPARPDLALAASILHAAELYDTHPFRPAPAAATDSGGAPGTAHDRARRFDARSGGRAGPAGRGARSGGVRDQPMSALSAMSRSLVDRVTPLSRERFGDLPVVARAVLCLYGALYVLAIVWAVPKGSLGGIVPLLVVLTAAGLERGWSDPAGQKVFIAGSGVVWS